MNTNVTSNETTTWVQTKFHCDGGAQQPMNRMASDSVSDDSAPAPGDSLKVWMDWRAGFDIANGVAFALWTLVEKGTIPVPAGIKPDMLALLRAFNTAIVAVDGAFYDYIQSDGKNAFVIDPPPLAPWPSPEGAGSKSDMNYFQAGFDVLKGALTLLSGQIQAKLTGQNDELKAAYDAIVTLVNSEQKILDSIHNSLNPPTPATV